MADRWSSRAYPDGCRYCGQTAGRHESLGLCKKHYNDPEINAWARSTDAPHYMIGAEGIEEMRDEMHARFEEEEGRPRERTPGTGTSPVTDAGYAPSDVKAKRRLFGSRKQETLPPLKATREKRPAREERRVSTAESVGDAWGAIGGLVERTGRHAPLGRYLQWQAPAAGEIVDEAVKGTIIDKKILQPAVRARGSLDALIAILGPPAIIMAIERNPERANTLLPALKAAIRSSLPTLLPAMKKAQARAEKVDKAVHEMFPDLDPSVDPVELVISEMFASWFPEGVPEEEPVSVAS